MKPNYTEYIVRVYHYKNEFSKTVFLHMKWIRMAVRSYLSARKITVKKHRELSAEEIINVLNDLTLDDFPTNCREQLIKQNTMYAKAIIKARGKG